MTEVSRDELLALERQGWTALCDGTAAAFYGRTMTADGVMVLANGQVMTREDVVASLDGAPGWDGFDLAEVRTIPLGEDSSALVYRATARRGEVAFEGWMSSTYVRRDGAWRLAVYTQTPVAG